MPKSLSLIVGTAIRLPVMILVSAPSAAIGGQAVMEGVMMRGPNHWAVAIRRYSGDVTDLHRSHVSYGRRHRWARLPIIRGVIALGESLAIGMRALSVSAHYAAEWYDEREDGDAVSDAPAADASGPDGSGQGAGGTAETHEASTTDEPVEATPEGLSRWQIAVSFVFAIGFSIALFKLFPAVLTNVAGFDSKSGAFVLVEAVLRISIFCAYLALVGLVPDMRRVFEYHSAEHKTINAWENDSELTPELVNEHSRIHVRCGTAFMLWVFVVAIAVFGIYGHFAQPGIGGIIASRILLLPLIAGISFELIKFAGRYPNNPFLRGVLAPGLWLQYLTTRPCNPEQCSVAIRSLEVVLTHEYPERSAGEARRALSQGDEAMQVMA